MKWFIPFVIDMPKLNLLNWETIFCKRQVNMWNYVCELFDHSDMNNDSKYSIYHITNVLYLQKQDSFALFLITGNNIRKYAIRWSIMDFFSPKIKSYSRLYFICKLNLIINIYKMGMLLRNEESKFFKFHRNYLCLLEQITQLSTAISWLPRFLEWTGRPF